MLQLGQPLGFVESQGLSVLEAALPGAGGDVEPLTSATDADQPEIRQLVEQVGGDTGRQLRTGSREALLELSDGGTVIDQRQGGCQERIWWGSCGHPPVSIGVNGRR